MGSKSKVQMFYTGDDRISSLPDPILCQILSSLPTLLVVGTSVLSTRWRSLWTSVPSLDFDDSYISTEDSDKELRERTNFMNFVEGVLDCRDSRVTLDKFSLKCRGYCDSDWVWECVCTAIQQDVKEIKLGLDLRDHFQFPTCFFVNQTLVVLRLDGKIVVDDPSEICFSNLKALHFNGVKFMRCESVGKILCGCPVVEELVIRYCEWVEGRTLSICGLALKDVTLEDSPTVFLGMDQGCEIVIDAPALERLAIADDALEKFVVKNLCSIVEANLDLAPIENVQKFPEVKDGNRVVGFLKDVSTVKFLSLSNETLESIRFADDYSLPIFHNLTTLKLTFDAWSGWFLLPHILACSPILENLVLEGLIEHFDFQLGQFLFNWYPPEHVPDCLLLHLKEIKILNFRGIPEELIFVKYLLKNARVLRKMLIDCSFSKDGQKLREKLLTFYRGSTTCYLDLIF